MKKLNKKCILFCGEALEMEYYSKGIGGF